MEPRSPSTSLSRAAHGRKIYTYRGFHRFKEEKKSIKDKAPRLLTSPISYHLVEGQPCRNGNAWRWSPGEQGLAGLQ